MSTDQEMDTLTINQLDNLQIVLCDTSHPGNIGSAARAMKNMGIFNLALVNPKILPNDNSLALSAHAKDVVNNAKILDNLDLAIDSSALVIGMTGRKREFNSELQTPREITPEIFNVLASNQQVTIVFGNEQHGLNITQLEKCNRIVTIPGNSKYLSLNLAQAVQIMCYEIHSQLRTNVDFLKNPVNLVNSQDVQHLLLSLDRVLVGNNFYHTKNRERTLRRLQQILHKANLAREDADLLHGIIKKFERQISSINTHTQ